GCAGTCDGLEPDCRLTAAGCVCRNNRDCLSPAGAALRGADALAQVRHGMASISQERQPVDTQMARCSPLVWDRNHNRYNGHKEGIRFVVSIVLFVVPVPSYSPAIRYSCRPSESACTHR